MAARNWWCFTFKARRQGSQGVWEPLKVQVRSDDPEQAKAWALDDAYAAGYETAGCIGVQHGFQEETKGNI